MPAPQSTERLPLAFKPVRPFQAGRNGFTLVEMLVAVSLLMLLALIIVQVTEFSFRISKRIGSSASTIQSAGLAFETMTRKIQQATLNLSYVDYYPSGTSSPPTAYIRRSDLHFITGYAGTLIGGDTSNYPTHAIFFAAPLGYTNNTDTTNSTSDYTQLTDLLNACGYFIKFDSDSSWIPDVFNLRSQNSTNRYRLMELLQPTENLQIYNYNASNPNASLKNQWFLNAVNIPDENDNPYYHPIADNVIALIIYPKYTDAEMQNNGSLASLSTDYTYDTRKDDGVFPQTAQNNQLPPVLRITMVTIDEPSAIRLAKQYGSTPPPVVDSNLFQSVSNYDQDLSTLTQSLSSQGLTYKIYTSDVPIRSAKWSN